MRNRLLLLGLILLLAVPLALVLHGFAREVVAVAILRFLWIGDLVFKSIPQPLLWTLFLVGALIIAGRSLVRGERTVWQGQKAETVREGRVQVLARWLHRATQGEYFKWNLAHYLGKLTLEALAYRERTSPEQARQRLRNGELDAPPEIQAYLAAGTTPVFSKPTGIFSRLRRRLRPGAQPSSLDLDPERVVQFLEDQLEVAGDHRNR